MSRRAATVTTTPTGMRSVHAKVGGTATDTVHTATEFTYADGSARLGWTHCGADSNSGSTLTVTDDPTNCPRCERAAH